MQLSVITWPGFILNAEISEFPSWMRSRVASSKVSSGAKDAGLSHWTPSPKIVLGISNTVEAFGYEMTTYFPQEEIFKLSGFSVNENSCKAIQDCNENARKGQ